MRAQCRIEFFDKAAKVTRKPGEVFDITVDRFNEITLKGRYIVAAPDDAPAKTASSEKK